MLNTKLKSNKFSCIDRRLNTFIIVYMIVLAVLTLLSFGLTFITLNIYNVYWFLYGIEPKFYYVSILFV